MDSSRDPKRQQELGSTYVVQDRSNQQELARLALQDQMLTTGMGGVLPEQPDPLRFTRILDVGCGTGNWLLELARTFPHLRRLVGVDISATMLGYAREQADTQQDDPRIEFAVMDALRMLEFPADTFGLVNARMAWSYLRTWDWPKYLREMRHVCRRGGIVRVTECDLYESNSQALSHLSALFLQALHQAGHFFRQERDGVSSELGQLLQQYGAVRHVKTQVHVLTLPAGTPAGQQFAQDVRLGFRTAQPFIRKWVGHIEDYEPCYQQMLSQVEHPNFVATWKLVTVWGEVVK
ncbi:class I SAM-dependent methyltransferase [Ktedonosporobacter rubrisoli]|uniref:Class I SAM-dependent methyltransferase n=1 Tax=Ktedonosporobacter rubrisoli TaxID=2509675 RepID=A0A4P6JNZ4_KTERU|nr:class I SAM-dependent methyltransferase [Ktedonosporobacter rubrisoli]QBD76792.1 class I SAM-dependent methyltransferase [Ktedonosporobacter rubrisoli]